MLRFRTKRSGGVRVTAAVHRAIAQGNAARDRADWAAAAAGFRAALRGDDGLVHIWVQLGHALKEGGRAAEAEAAYLRAVALRPDAADPHLHLGHLFNRDGAHAKAGHHYLLAFQADPNLVDAASALHRAIARARGRKREALLAVLRAASAEEPEAEPAAAAAGEAAGPAFVFDVSDLIGYFAHGRAPTGIQRVQIQVIRHALERPAGAVRICCFIDGRDEWLEIAPARLLHLVELSLASSDRADPAWIAALHRLHLRLAMAPGFDFPRGSFLVNLGSSWQLPNYFLFVRAAKARFGIRYVPFVHDLIPIVAPEHFVRAARREVVPWVLGVLSHADHVLVNSEATKRDLLGVAARVGEGRLAAADVAVIRLDADFRKALPAAGGAAGAPEVGEPFVLLVSTVESRKGHATAFDAWAALIARRGAAGVPMLVCVGKRGWLSGAVYRRLAEDPVLASRVSMRAAVSDEALAGLYRDCLFTIYPSLYEGWGLPITEALSYGKPVIASNTSSLPEAGGSYAVYVEPGSVPALAAAVERMATDAPYREAIAARIRAGFRPRGWGELADQVQGELVRRAGLCPARRVLPAAQLGAFHSVARSTALRVWPGAGVGEAFRAGSGWSSPERDGSWTRPEGGRLLMALPRPCGAVRVGLLLLGSPEGAVDWCVQVRDGVALEGTLERGGRGWVTFEHAPGGRGVLELLLWTDAGEWEAAGEEAEGTAEDEAPLVGLAGFFVHERDDAAAGLRLLQAAALGNLDAVDAFRPPAPAPWAVAWD